MAFYNIFKILAYQVVSQSYGLDDQGSSDGDSDASDLEVMDVSVRQENFLNYVLILS